MNKLMIDTTIEGLVYGANIVAKTQESKVGFVGYAKSLSKGLVKMMCMEDTYIVLQGKRFDCCRYCKSLTIGDTSSYRADSNSHVREVYEND